MVRFNRVSVISLVLISIGFLMAYVGVLGSSDLHVALVILGSVTFLSGMLGASFIVALPIRRALRRYIEVLNRRARK